MHRRALLASAASAALSACSGGSAPTGSRTSEAAPPQPATPAARYASGGFDVAFFRALAAEPGNQFVSPFSIACAFALLYPGASGQTAAEIAAFFGFDASPAAEARETRALMQSLTTQTGGSEFTAANAAWVERTMQLRAEYARAIREQLGATIEPVDFIANQASALRRINSWAARETQGRIPIILASQNPDRRLVLANAVYFKGKWSNPFSASATREGEFHAARGAERAQLMRRIMHVRYAEDATIQAAELEYDEGAFALTVFLPRARTGLTAFERDLTGGSLNAWLERLSGAQQARLDLTLPKLEVNADYDLSPQLQALGVRRAFTSGAEFADIANDASLAISAVIHKTFLAIDEEGTEAAAVTAIDMATTSAPGAPPPPPIEFKADHPFFIVLSHKPTRTRVFLGRIATIAS